jgi:hypothetical protein
VEIRQTFKRTVSDEQHLTTGLRIFQVLNDGGEDPFGILAVDRPDAHFRCLGNDAGDGLVEQAGRGLDENDFVAILRHTDHEILGSVSFSTASWGGAVENTRH